MSGVVLTVHVCPGRCEQLRGFPCLHITIGREAAALEARLRATCAVCSRDVCWSEMAKLNFSRVALVLHPTDNVAVLKHAVQAGDELQDGPAPLQLQSDVAPGHKIALHSIPHGAPVIKYGQVIGFARVNVLPGQHVHTHNVETRQFSRDYQFC